MEYIFLTRLKKFIPNWNVVKPYVLMETRKVKTFSKSIFDVDDFLRKELHKVLITFDYDDSTYYVRYLIFFIYAIRI